MLRAGAFVRRDWLAAFAARKTAPKGSAAFIARVVTEHPEVVASVGGSQLAAEWFGLTHAGYGYGNGWSALVDKANDGRALGRLLASLEKGTNRQSWRRMMPATADYLTFIATHGYDLSDVEKRAAGLSKPKPASRARATKAVSASEPTAADGAGTGAMHDQDVTATEADDQDAQARSADGASAA